MRRGGQRPVRRGAARGRGPAAARAAAAAARARLQRVRHRQGDAVRSPRARQGARGGRLGREPARPRDRDAAALGRHQQPARHRGVPAGARRARGRRGRRAAVHAAAVGSAPGPPGGGRGAAARRRRPRAARRRGLRQPAPGGAVRAHGRGGLPGGARRAARRGRRGRHDAAHVGVLEGGGRGPRAPAADAGRQRAARRPGARQHGAALGHPGAQLHRRLHPGALRRGQPGRAQPARRDAAGHAAGGRRRALARRQGGRARARAQPAARPAPPAAPPLLRQEVPVVDGGGDAVPGLLPDGAGAGDGGAVRGEGLPARVLLLRAAFPLQPAIRRRPQEHLPAERVPRHQGLVLHHVAGVRGGRGVGRRHGRVPGGVGRAVADVPALVARRPRRDRGEPRRQVPHHRGAVGERRGRRRLRAGALLLRLPRAAPAALQALLRVQPLRGALRPPLPMGRQLHRREEPPPLRGLPGQPARHVRLHGVGLRAVPGGALRRRARRRRAGRGAGLAALQRLGVVGGAQRAVPPVLGAGADVLPAVPGGVPGHDHQRAAQPRPLPALPGARRPLAVLARAAAQRRRLLPLPPVRAAAARRARPGAHAARPAGVSAARAAAARAARFHYA